jgi:hypothetical protein
MRARIGLILIGMVLPLSALAERYEHPIPFIEWLINIPLRMGAFFPVFIAIICGMIPLVYFLISYLRNL